MRAKHTEMPYLQNRLDDAELDRIADVIKRGPYEGYPTQEHRLHLGATGLIHSGTTLIVPEGPWQVTNHINRRNKHVELLDPEAPSETHPRVLPELSERWLADGLMLDQHGRPLHPYWRQLLADERIGLPTGAGFFYRYGPNATVDPVIYRSHGSDPMELLLIRRGKGGQWALPGGFIDRTDTSSEGAARREGGEETHLDNIGGTGEVILHKRSVGFRDTLHAWTENTVVLLHGNQDYLFDTEPTPGDDAIDVGWFKREQIAELDVFDAHNVYIELAYERIYESFNLAQ